MSLENFITKDYSMLSADDLASKAISLFTSGIKAILIQGAPQENAVVTRKTVLGLRGPPDRTKLRNLFIHMPVLDVNTTNEETVKTLLLNGLDAVPVSSKGETLGIVTEQSLLKLIGKDYKETAKDVMTPGPLSIGMEDDVSTARNMMIENNVSKLVVLDKTGKPAGVIEDIDIFRTFISVDEHRGKGTGPGEKITERVAPVRDVMQSVFYSASPDESISKIATNLQKHREAIIIEEGNPVGIITPKDILEIIPLSKEGIYVQITGMHDEDEFIKSEVHSEIDRVVKKIAAVVNVQFVWIHLKRHHENGKVKYSVRVRASTDWDLFVSKYWGFDLIDATSKAMKEMEREVLKRKEKELTRKKGRSSAKHGRKD